MHDDDQYKLMMQGLTPSEHNPLDHEPRYNPLRHCYNMTATVDDVDYEIAVTFQLQLWEQTTPIEFTDPETGEKRTIPFFPKMSEHAIDPIINDPEPNLKEGYQLGEPKYYLVPVVHRCKHLETGKLLDRESTRTLITPDILQEAIVAFRDQVEQDKNAPAILSELLDMWDPALAYRYTTDEDWDNEDDEEEDGYYT